METSDKIKAAIIAAAVLGAFAAGRYTAPAKVKVETKTVEVEKKVEQKERDRHRETVIVEVTKPDGTRERTSKTVEDTETKTQKTDNLSTSTSQLSEVTRKNSVLAVSLLAGARPEFSGGFSVGPFVYGAHVSKQVLGPISLGAWGLTSGEFGLSAGLQF